ncbi:MAG: hypothetical protein R2788_26530 [Saprospiraceae bacterium]
MKTEISPAALTGIDCLLLFGLWLFTDELVSMPEDGPVALGYYCG